MQPQYGCRRHARAMCTDDAYLQALHTLVYSSDLLTPFALPAEWDGGLVLVSHDFRLISQVSMEHDNTLEHGA